MREAQRYSSVVRRADPGCVAWRSQSAKDKLCPSGIAQEQWLSVYEPGPFVGVPKWGVAAESTGFVSGALYPASLWTQESSSIERVSDARTAIESRTYFLTGTPSRVATSSSDGLMPARFSSTITASRCF